MRNPNKRHRITITVSDRELNALEDALMVWNLCKKHKARTWTPEHGQKSEQEIFKMQDECTACKNCNRRIHRLAMQVAFRLFSVWDKTY
jgi:hypothetical protein